MDAESVSNSLNFENTVYLPQIAPDRKPKMGQEFDTREIFNLFQNKLWNSLILMAEFVMENENYLVYYDVCKKYGVARVFEVYHDKNSEFVSYICKKFESEGVPCTHILVLFNKLQIKFLPDAYILKRWTIAPKFEQVIDDAGVVVNDISDRSLLYRKTMLSQLASNVIDKAVFSEETSKVLCDSLEVAWEKIKSISESFRNEELSDSFLQQPHFKEPLQVRAKGCGKRLKGGKEKAKEKTKYKGRRCNGFSQVSQSHDKRNCPLLMMRSEVSLERNRISSDSDNGSQSS